LPKYVLLRLRHERPPRKKPRMPARVSEGKARRSDAYIRFGEGGGTPEFYRSVMKMAGMKSHQYRFNRYLLVDAWQKEQEANLKQIYRSIRHRIETRVLRTHAECIKHSLRYPAYSYGKWLPERTPCEAARAYLMWKAFWEHYIIMALRKTVWVNFPDFSLWQHARKHLES
jgi:hypothetical protein